MNILIVGAGAIGGYYGGVLAEAKHEVLFLARGANARAMADAGLTLESPTGTRTVAVQVVETLSSVPPASIDLALVTVKAPDLPAVAEGVGRALRPDGVAIPLLNGLDSEHDLADVIGPERVIGGIAQIAASMSAPGHVRVRAEGRVVLAPLEESQFQRTEELAALLTKAGLQSMAQHDLSLVLWNKLLWNAPFNAACALTGLPAGRVLAIAELRALVALAIEEVSAVARASGVPISPNLAENLIGITEKSFADSVPSMLQDVLRGKPTEVEALQGAVVRRGRQHGVPTPMLDALYALMLGVEERRTRG